MKKYLGRPLSIFIGLGGILLILACTNEQDQKTHSTLAESPLRYTMAEDGLRFREAPQQNATILALIPLNTQVEIVEEAPETITIDNIMGHWTKIRWQEREGWVFGGYLSSRPKEVETSLLKSHFSFEEAREEPVLKMAKLQNQELQAENPLQPKTVDHELVYFNQSLYVFLKPGFKPQAQLSIKAVTVNLKEFSQLLGTEDIIPNSERLAFKIPFFNYYWLNSPQYQFSVLEGKEVLFSTSLAIASLEMLIYIQKAESPFKSCLPTQFRRRQKYICDLALVSTKDKKDEELVVFYYSPDNQSFFPFIALKGIAVSGPRKILSFSFTAKAASGCYLIRSYHEDELPQTEAEAPIQDAIYLP